MSDMKIQDIKELRRQAEANTYEVHGDPVVADCIIGFSFGYAENMVDGKKTVQPGKSNLQLAAFIEANFTRLPLIVQFEIADGLVVTKPALVVKEHRQAGEYLNSREIAEQALEYMRVNNWNTAVIVTHPAMEARNDAICRKLGMETITPAGLESIEYDELSVQAWTRSRAAWWKREKAVINICVVKGWI